jgi:hypothetical protein
VIRYTKEQVFVAFSESNSIASALVKLGLKGAGANYRMAHRMIKEYEIDISHMLGQAHLRNKTHNWHPKRELKDILIENSPNVSSNDLRVRLITEGIFERKCYSCFLEEWLSVPIPLELEHKNGNHSDNRLDNLTLLCPNCHAQTSTYRGKNRKSKRKRKCLI